MAERDWPWPFNKKEEPAKTPAKSATPGKTFVDKVQGETPTKQAFKNRLKGGMTKEEFNKL